MKTIPHLLLVSFLLLAMVSPEEALAGSCGSNRCNATYVAPYAPRAPAVPSAPATASASHAFTAIGGSRVADINLSQEARDGINAGGKEEPLPKGFSTAADRAKLVAKQSPLYGWPQNEIRRPSSRAQSHYSIATRVLRNSLLKPREAKPFTRRSVASPVKPAVKVAITANAKSEN
jgi:hypothetical protein